MRHAVLRTTFLIAVVMLVCGANSSYGRGPGGGGGRGGNAGGRAGGGGGNRGLDLSKRDVKKNDGPNLNAINANGGLNETAKKFQGAPGKFSIQDGSAQQNWKTRNGEFQQKGQSAFQDFNNGPQPITAEWYADHPAAWQSTHPHADAWAVASAAGVAAWLGWAAQPAYGTSNTVVYQEAPAEETDSSEDAYSNQSESTQDDTEWLALGVYSVLSNTGEPTSRLLQLTVNRQGDLRGVYYDSITATSQNLSGRIDQSTQLAQWSLDSNPQISFRANLNQLTQPTGTIEVTQPAGNQQWRIARQENNG